MATVNAIVIGSTFEPETTSFVLSIRYIMQNGSTLSDHLYDHYFQATTDAGALYAAIKQGIIDQQIGVNGPTLAASDILLMFAAA